MSYEHPSKVEVGETPGACNSWWGSRSHFDYLHRCTQPEEHPKDGCKCLCGKKPPKGSLESVRKSRKIAQKRRNND